MSWGIERSYGHTAARKNRASDRRMTFRHVRASSEEIETPVFFQEKCGRVDQKKGSKNRSKKRALDHLRHFATITQARKEIKTPTFFNFSKVWRGS